MVLRLIQEREGCPLAEVQAWSVDDKLERVVSRLMSSVLSTVRRS
jgi:hypothetical protein